MPVRHTLLKPFPMHIAAVLLGVCLHVCPAPAAALDIAVISDLNSSFGSADYESTVDAAVRRLIELRPDLVLLTGDMVAGQARPPLSTARIADLWRAFDVHVRQPLVAAGIPLVATPGNHDASAYADFAGERDAYAGFWSARRPVVEFIDDEHYPFYFGFGIDGVLFVSLDATVVGPIPQQQRAWLQHLLATRGARYDYRIAFGHLPIWPFAQGRENETLGDLELADVLRRNRVDVLLSGHHHAFYPAARQGLAMVGQACLGAGRRRLLGDANRAPRAITVLRTGSGVVEVGALVGPGFDTLLPWPDLPEQIRSATGILERADLVDVSIRELRSAGAGSEKKVESEE